MKRVKRVEDLNVRTVRAQGIVGVGVIIRTCTASCQAGACHPMAHDGWRADRGSSCRCVSSPVGSVSCSSHG